MSLAPPLSHTPPHTPGLLGDDLVDSRHDSVPDLAGAQTAAAARRAKRRSYRRSFGAPPHSPTVGHGANLTDAERLKEAYRSDGAGAIRASPQFAQSMSYLPDNTGNNRMSTSSTHDSNSAGEPSPTPSPFVDPLPSPQPLRASSAAHAIIQRKMLAKQQRSAAMSSALSLSAVPLENEVYTATSAPQEQKERNHRVFFSKPESTFGRWVNKLVRRGGVKA